MSGARVSPATALGVAVLGIALFSVMDAFMKALVLAIGVYNALLWRTGIATLMGAAAWKVSGGRRPGARALRIHALRGGVTAAMSLLFFWGLARVPMAQAISLTYIAPILALLLAAVVLGERVGRRTVVASIAALAGVLVVLAGSARVTLADEALAGSAAILTSACLYAANLVIARVQAQAAGPGEIALFQSGVVMVVLAVAAPWLAVVPAAAHWPQLAIAAALATASLWLLGWAYAHADTGFLAMSEYSSFVHAALLGWLVFGERLSPWTLAGAAIIVAASLYAVRGRNPGGGALEAAA